MASLPNLLTVLRVILTPAIVFFILNGRCDLALPISIVAGATDAADGYFARKLGSVSRLGAWLDPIADKLLLTSLYITFGVAALIPPWLAWLVVGRDVLILAMAAGGLLLTPIRDFPPTFWGKLSTVIQIGASLVFLTVCMAPPEAKTFSAVAVLAVALATAWSGIHYVWVAARMFRGSREIV